MMSFSRLGSCLSIFFFAAFVLACGEAGSSAASADSPSNVSPGNDNGTLAASNGTPESGSAKGKPFKTTVELHGISFLVESPNSGETNFVKVTPSGLEITNEPVAREVSGEVVGAEIGDLNIDQSPEVYIYVSKGGDRKGMNLVAFAANSRKSMSEIALQLDDPNSKAMDRYIGGDEYAVVENSIVRRFPLSAGEAANSNNAVKMRQIQYKLKKGEATWQLVPEKTTEY